jgi:ATP-dependent DNA helicase PIF1
LTPAEVATFNDATRLFFKRRDVDDANHTRMRDLNKPIIAINALHDHEDSRLLEPAVAHGLHPVVRLSIGCRVMFQQNIWTEAGIVNGRQGIVYDIVWPEGTDDPRKEPPLFVMVAFEGLRDDTPQLLQWQGRKVLPIYRVRHSFYHKNKPGWREQFPLSIRYAMTVHKAQGMTLDEAVIDLGKEFSTGLNYVAISRLKNLDSLLLNKSVDFDLLKNMDGRPTA